MRFGKTKGEIWVEKGDFRGDFEGFWPCLGISHPTHPHLEKKTFPKKTVLFLGGSPKKKYEIKSEYPKNILYMLLAALLPMQTRIYIFSIFHQHSTVSSTFAVKLSDCWFFVFCRKDLLCHSATVCKAVWSSQIRSSSNKKYWKSLYNQCASTLW